MASEPPASKKLKSNNKNNNRNTHKKLFRLPPTHQISKRPLLHAPIPSPRTSSLTPKIIYISSSSPFISIIKRVHKLLGFVEGRASGDVQLTRDGKGVMKRIEDGIVGRGRGGKFGNGGKGKGDGKEASRPREEEIQLRATGRAIQKALQVAIQLQGEEGLRVRFETGSAGAVDDVVERENTKSKRVEVKDGGDQEDVGDGDGMDIDTSEGVGEEEVEVEESRVRRVSCLIIFVGLK